jgi:hypothetical protein
MTKLHMHKPSNKQIYGSGKYLHGDCHIFALALRRVFGYQIAMIEDKDRIMWSDKKPDKEMPYIPHVFCVKGEYIIDVFGYMKPDVMIQGVGKTPIKRYKIHKIDPRSLYKNSIFTIGFNKITEPQIEEAVQFINKHKEHYLV